MKIDFPSAKDIPALRRLWKDAFADDDTFLDAFFSGAFSFRRCRTVFCDGKVVAALYWFDCQCYEKPMAYIYAVATHKDYRHRGLCRLLMEDTHTVLCTQGYCGSILVPSDVPLSKMYAAMGYDHFAGINTVDINAALPICLQNVSWEEYAALRCKYLPDGGVTQSGLDFLSHFTTFYKGADCIAAVSQQAGSLLILELLGNRQSAGGILAALGKKNGHLRNPGNTPFAMYHSLDGTPAPNYFAFAFD